MRFALLSAGACLLCFLSSVPGVAKAQESKWYSGEGKYYLAVFAGTAYPEDLQNVSNPTTGAQLADREVNANFPTNFDEIDDFDLDGIYGIKVGFIPEKDYTWFGLEAEYFVTNTEVLPGGGLTNANLEVQALSLNFVLRYPDFWIEPYIGVGPSLMWASSHQFQGADGGDSITAPGLNLLAGLRIPIFNRMMLFGEYKHTRATLDFKSIRVDYRLHALVAGVGVMF